MLSNYLLLNEKEISQLGLAEERRNFSAWNLTSGYFHIFLSLFFGGGLGDFLTFSWDSRLFIKI